MADYLVYWKTHWQEAAEQGKSARHTTDTWSTKSKGLYDTVKRRDRLWVVISGGEQSPEEWRLAQVFYVAGPDPEQYPSRWGRYHIRADRQRTRAFNITIQPDLTGILWMLDFCGGKRIKALGKKIGRSLQSHGYRRLSARDALLLESYADVLKSPSIRKRR